MDAPAFLQLAGHPLRWQLLGELGRSDRQVHELTSLVGEPQNLVSYHLGKLRSGGLVTSRRSSADGRDTYYAVDLPYLRERLAAVGPAVHPGLQLWPHALRPGSTTASVLFLCTGNSARSQMAEALARRRSGGRVEACSAGSHPKPVHPFAVQAMKEEFGISLRGATSRHLSTFEGCRFDRVVTLCDRVREVCPEWPGAEAVHWSTPDPSGEDLEHFRRLAHAIDTRVGFLVAALTQEDS